SRASTFLISDGVLPSNEGRGYVLRKIIRRAITHGRLLNQTKPFLYEMVFAVRDLMQDAYPELKESADRVSKAIHAEETRFAHTLDLGLKRLEEDLQPLVEAARKNPTAAPLYSGEKAFKLYDTFSMPPAIRASFSIRADSIRPSKSSASAPRPPGKAASSKPPTPPTGNCPQLCSLATSTSACRAAKCSPCLKTVLASRILSPMKKARSSSTRRPSTPSQAARLAIAAGSTPKITTLSSPTSSAATTPSRVFARTRSLPSSRFASATRSMPS